MKIGIFCTDCGYEEYINIADADGSCPMCHEHHGVNYASAYSSKDLVAELAKLSEKEISNYAELIKIMAADCVENEL